MRESTEGRAPARRCGLMRWAVIALTAWALVPAAQAEDLMQAYQQARLADPVLSAADARRLSVREGVTQARAPLWPQLSAGASLQQTRVAGEPAIEASRARAVSATLSQTLLDSSRVSQWHVAQAQADAQAQEFRAEQQALCVRVATAYVYVLTATDALANVLANEDAYRQQVDQAEQRFHNGLSAEVDVQQARAYHAAAQASTIGARQALADAREALAEITGTPMGELKALRDDLPMALPQPADPQAWVTLALSQNPTLLAQREGVHAAEEGIAAARAGHLPTLTAALDVGRAAQWPVAASSSDHRTATTVGLVLNVPLFAGGATQSQVRQAVHQRDGALDELEIRRRRVAREVRDQYGSVVASMAQTEAGRAAVEAARKALASTRVGQGLGTQTMTDLLLAIQTLTSAQAAYSQARHQVVLSRLKLLQAAGAIDEADLVAVNALLS